MTFGRGLILKLLAIPLVFFVVGVAVPGFFGYKLLDRNAEREVEEKARMLSRTVDSFLMATKGAKPGAASSDSIRCEAGYELRRAMRRHEAGPREVPWRFKHAALNSTDKQNRADAYESRLIATFEADRTVRKIEETANIGRGYHVIAKPTVATESCLRCHGDPTAAPVKKREEYGRVAGFNWRKGQVVGATVIYVPTSYVESQASNIFWTLLKIVSLLSAMCCALLIWRVRSVVVTPVKRLLETSWALRKGDFTATYPKAGTADEMDELAEGFEEATHYLKARLVAEEKTRSLFQQFIPASIGAQALGRDPNAVMKGNRQAVTVMIINIRNFKLLMANLEPDHTVNTLNDFFSTVNKVITDHNGMVSKYLGDTVLAFFGMPVAGDNHALNAVKAALELPKALQNLYVRLDEKYGWELGIGVGISTGEPIVGQFGSSEHFEYTVLGDVVGDAHKLEEVTKGIPEEDSIVIGESTYREIMSQVQVFDLGEKQLRNGSMVRAFAVQGLRTEVRETVKT